MKASSDPNWKGKQGGRREGAVWGGAVISYFFPADRYDTSLLNPENALLRSTLNYLFSPSLNCHFYSCAKTRELLEVVVGAIRAATEWKAG